MERLADAYSTDKAERRVAFSPHSLDGYAVDLFAIAAVAVVLVLVMQTRPSFQNQLVLFYDDPTLHAFYTTHFVHSSPAHLQSNAAMYLVVVPLTYLISLQSNRHREFRLGFLAVLFIMPPVISLASYLGLDLVIETIFGFDPNVRSSRGFSALVGAFVGMLTVSVADLFRNLAPREGSYWPVIGVMFWYGVATAFFSVFQYLVSPWTVLLVLLPTGYTVWLVRKVGVEYGLSEGLQEDGWLRGQPVTVGLLVVGFMAAVWGTRGLLAFPWFAGGTNTLSHFVGLLTGLGVTSLVIDNRKN
ncbi:hypothetical protein [Halorussus aquaticus]|uniref:Rhomboid family protein n=1 Tax=Halorussus aquaticus TaxID=2953748 RepID=A0ABD5Q8F6_9EURY|nr:hypothetical protein [Halorussus aquaticus]